MSRVKLLSLLLAISLSALATVGCGVDCAALTDCQICTESACVWVEWQDGATECVADKDDLPPADTSIVEDTAQCGG